MAKKPEKPKDGVQGFFLTSETFVRIVRLHEVKVTEPLKRMFEVGWHDVIEAFDDKDWARLEHGIRRALGEGNDLFSLEILQRLADPKKGEDGGPPKDGDDDDGESPKNLGDTDQKKQTWLLDVPRQFASAIKGPALFHGKPREIMDSVLEWNGRMAQALRLAFLPPEEIVREQLGSLTFRLNVINDKNESELPGKGQDGTDSGGVCSDFIRVKGSDVEGALDSDDGRLLFLYRRVSLMTLFVLGMFFGVEVSLQKVVEMIWAMP